MIIYQDDWLLFLSSLESRTMLATWFPVIICRMNEYSVLIYTYIHICIYLSIHTQQGFRVWLWIFSLIFAVSGFTLIFPTSYFFFISFWFWFWFFFFLKQGKGGEREGKKQWGERKTSIGCLGYSQLGTEPATQACALTRKQTDDFSVFETEPNQVSYTGWGPAATCFSDLLVIPFYNNSIMDSLPESLDKHQVILIYWNYLLYFMYIFLRRGSSFQQCHIEGLFWKNRCCRELRMHVRMSP